MVSLAPGVVVQVAAPVVPVVTVTAPAAVSPLQVVAVPGIPGPPGRDAAAVTGFSYVQTTPAASWPVVHNLGRHPYAVTLTVGTSQVFTDLDFPDLNTVVLTFATPTAGRVDII